MDTAAHKNKELIERQCAELDCPNTFRCPPDSRRMFCDAHLAERLSSRKGQKQS